MPADQYQQYLKTLAARRAPALAHASTLIDAQRLDEADREVPAVDDSIYGAVAMADLYRAKLAASADQPPAHRCALFDRAWRWANAALPSPHTAVEAEDNDRHLAAVRADLTQLLGHDPAQHDPAAEHAR